MSKHGAMSEGARVVASPLGSLRLAANVAGLTHVEFLDDRDVIVNVTGDAAAAKHLNDAVAQLEEYFAGERRSFDLALSPNGTAFQLASWAVLRTIPFGSTMTYGDQARATGAPRAARAVGGANGKNPLAIVVPCHRVIGASGELTGYASGVARKSWLLDHERAILCKQK